jgi:opacity protein-like surface antigen
LSNNKGYYVSGNAGYAYSDRTQLTFVVGYTGYDSDVSRSSGVTSTVGVVHQFSPQLTVSASAGAFWSDTDLANDTLAGGGSRRDSGGLFGGSIAYAFSERTDIAVALSEGLSPSSSGALSKTDLAAASIVHRFSERLTGRMGASYERTIVPAINNSTSSTSSQFSAEVGMSYALAERWKLDAGYRFTAARYEQVSGEPKSNVAFISIAYNWPGASFTDWVGRRPDVQGMPWAGAVALPARPTGPAPSVDVPPAPSLPGPSPFDPLTIP